MNDARDETTRALMQRALDECGDSGRDATYFIAIPMSVTGGTWKLSFGGRDTIALPAFALPAQVEAALQTLPNIGDGNAQVLGVKGGPFTIRLTGDLGAQELSPEVYPLTANGSELLPPAELPIEVKDVGAVRLLSSRAAALADDYANATNHRQRFLMLKRDLLELMLGEAQKRVDASANGRDEKLSQQFAQIMARKRDCEAELRTLTDALTHAAMPVSSNAATGRITRNTPNGLPYGVLPR